MSIFGSIMQKIFHHPQASSSPSASPDAAGATGTAPAASSPFEDGGATATAPASSPASAAQPTVDVGAVLAQMASTKGGGGNYKVSIVDLLQLLDLDHSLDARRQLAQELNVHAGADGTAEQNIALHKAVMQKLAENGGKVPDSMKA